MSATLRFKFSSFVFILHILIPEICSQPMYYYYHVAGRMLVPMGSDGTVPGNLWQYGSQVKVIVHGWNPFAGDALREQNMITLARAFGDFNPFLNIILVDWTYRANAPLTHYHVAVEGTKDAAAEIADFLILLTMIGLIDDLRMVHCLGHSLGSHVCGVTGYLIQRATMGYMIGRITGLDPAGPSFSTPNGDWPRDRTILLDYSDAEFVDIIHTNAGSGKIDLVILLGRLGSNLKAGHIDYYPNGGSNQRYHCNLITDRTELCSHKISVLFYVLSLRYPMAYVACPCDSYTNFAKGRCQCSLGDTGIALGELATRPAGQMKYYVKINTPI